MAETVPGDVSARVANLREKLLNADTTLSQRYRVLFSLRNVPGDEARAALLCGLKDPSALFRHEVAYCLGQKQDPAAVKILSEILADRNENPMVRHEAGEALGAIGTPECIAPLQNFRNDPSREVSETCELALARIDHYKRMQQRKEEGTSGTDCGTPRSSLSDCGSEVSPYLSVDPTPAAPASIPVSELESALLDDSAKMFDRYKALFGLRNLGGDDAIHALGRSFESESALLKHEVAYVLGQMQDPAAEGILTGVLRNSKEHPMVRHEAAEALGSIAQESCIALLREYVNDPEPIVGDSCVVALDMLEYEKSGDFQYADMGGDA